jgi:N-acyl-D-aspartate/D-glutamate deacylase
MADYDVAYIGGSIVDGSGCPAVRGDIATKDGRIAEVGTVSGSVARRIDVDGLVIAPGIIDVHSHYDAQVCWDALLMSSAEHGATTVVQGNCGIGVAPCKPADREAAIRDLEAIEGMSYDVLTAGIEWAFETFPEYLAHLRRRGLGINLAAFVPLSPLRRWVLGDEASERAAKPEERVAIAALLREAMEAGALGFSATMTKRHVGYKGRPLACRMADRDELRAYANVLRDLGRGVIQVNTFDRTPYPSAEELARLDLLLTESGRPVTFSGGHFRAEDPRAIDTMLDQVAGFRARGAMPQAMIRPLTNQVDFRSPFVLGEIPAFRKVLNESLETQRRVYSDPEWRAEVKAILDAGRINIAHSWKSARVQRVSNPSLRALLGRSVDEIGAERGVHPFDAMLDITLADGLETRFLFEILNTDPVRMRRHIVDPRVMIGLADGGAHVDQLFETSFPTYMLGHWVRRERALTLEHAIKRMTSEPADFFGFRDRGRIAVDAVADLFVFDPATVDAPAMATEVRRDLPAGGERLYAQATGVAYVVVNGEVLIESGRHTGALPGTLIADR